MDFSQLIARFWYCPGFLLGFRGFGSFGGFGIILAERLNFVTIIMAYRFSGCPGQLPILYPAKQYVFTRLLVGGKKLGFVSVKIFNRSHRSIFFQNYGFF